MSGNTVEAQYLAQAVGELQQIKVNTGSGGSGTGTVVTQPVAANLQCTVFQADDTKLKAQVIQTDASQLLCTVTPAASSEFSISPAFGSVFKVNQETPSNLQCTVTPAGDAEFAINSATYTQVLVQSKLVGSKTSTGDSLMLEAVQTGTSQYGKLSTITTQADGNQFRVLAGYDGTSYGPISTSTTTNFLQLAGDDDYSEDPLSPAKKKFKSSHGGAVIVQQREPLISSTEVFLNSSAASLIYANSRPTPSAPINGDDCWYYKNSYGGPLTNKMNFYFPFGGFSEEGYHLDDIDFAYAVISINSAVSSTLPFFVVNGGDNTGFELNRTFTINTSLPQAVPVAEKFLLYFCVRYEGGTVTDADLICPELYPELRRVRASVITTSNPLPPTGNLRFISLHSDSGAAFESVQYLIYDLGFKLLRVGGSRATISVREAKLRYPRTQLISGSNAGVATALACNSSGHLLVDIQDTTVPVSGSVIVSNFPASQAVTGSVTANQATSSALKALVDINPSFNTISGTVSLSSNTDIGVRPFGRYTQENPPSTQNVQLACDGSGRQFIRCLGKTSTGDFVDIAVHSDGSIKTQENVLEGLSEIYINDVFKYPSGSPIVITKPAGKTYGIVYQVDATNISSGGTAAARYIRIYDHTTDPYPFSAGTGGGGPSDPTDSRNYLWYWIALNQFESKIYTYPQGIKVLNNLYFWGSTDRTLTGTGGDSTDALRIVMYIKWF